VTTTIDLSYIVEPLRTLAVPLDTLALDPKNARKHGEANLEAIGASLGRFGQRLPIVVQRQGMVVRAGNGRVVAARKLGWTHMAAVVVDESDIEAATYALADNRTGDLAEWDDSVLVTLLESLPQDMRAFTGFDAEAMGELLDAVRPRVTEDDGVDVAPVAVAAIGDLWQLGSHRLLCGDSTKLEDVRRVLDGRQPALCATDPPYLVDYTGERPNDSGKDWSGSYKEIEITDAGSFFRSLFSNIKAVVAPNSAIYCWHAHKRQRLIAEVWEELGILDHQQIVWVKPTPVFGRVFWHFRHEPCMMGWVQGSMPEHDSDHEFNSVWEIDWEGKSRIVGNEHPTQKPVEIFARPIRKHTKMGDTVFEPFSGSGSQLIAAEQTQRRCCAIEISPVFVDAGIRRWEKLTGKQAVHAETGRTWTETAADRGVAVG
jgi:DNA modification methylase